jgi:hypothetical protein
VALAIFLTTSRKAAVEFWAEKIAMVQKGSKEARNKGMAAIVGPRMSIESSRPRGRRRAFGLLLVGLAALPATISSAADRSADGGLAAHWNFEEGAGDTVKDSSGNGNDSAIVATPPSEAKWAQASSRDRSLSATAVTSSFRRPIPSTRHYRGGACLPSKPLVSANFLSTRLE